MNEPTYRFIVGASDELSVTESTQSLLSELRGLQGVLEVTRQKEDESTMDLGAIVTVIAASGATLAIAQGLSDWLRRRRGTILKVERHSQVRSIKVEVENIDPATALRITEVIRES